MTRTINLTIVVSTLCVACVALPRAAVPQDASPGPTPQQTAAEPADSTADAAKKAEILDSPQWRRVMFEFKEWLAVQTVYDEQQVAQIQDRFNRRVAAMSAGELELLLADMQAKFQILNSPRALEARTWLGSYLAVMSDNKRASILQEIPKIGTMSAARLEQELIRIEQKRARIEQKQGTFRSSQQARVSKQLERNRAAQQTAARTRSTATTFSPYHSPSDVNARLNQTPLGPRTTFSVGPLGGIRRYITPSSW